LIDITNTIGIIAVVTLCTIILRAAPFIVFGSRKTVPAQIAYLGKVLPPAIMVTLVFYCLRNIDFLSVHGWLAEIIASVLVVILHLWKKNILLTVAVSTIAYMLMIQLNVFGSFM